MLLDQRGVTAIGHEQLDTDPGLATSRGESELELLVLSRDRWQIEALKNLDKVPEAGALIMAFNVTMTILGYQRDEKPIGGVVPALGPTLQPAE